MTPADMKAVRKSLGLRQVDLAELLRVKAGARIVGAWERGERTPSGPVLVLYHLLRIRPKLAKEMPGC